MAVWPFYVVICALLTCWGAAHNAWIAPALALVGFLGVRVVMWGLDPHYHEVAICTLWLIVASLMMYRGYWIPGFFFTLSALTYPLLLLIGFRVEWMGFMPIVADGFAVLALLSIGGGIFGNSRAPDDYRESGFGMYHSKTSMAARSQGNTDAR